MHTVLDRAGPSELTACHRSRIIIALCVVLCLTSYVQPAGRMRPSLGFRCSKSTLHTDNLFLFDNLEPDSFDAGRLQCHFITSVTTAVRIRTISVF